MYNFFTPRTHPHIPLTCANSLTVLAENTFSFRKNQIVVTGARNAAGKELAYLREESTYFSTTNKIAILATGILPFVFLIVKCTSRLLHPLEIFTFEHIQRSMEDSIFTFHARDLEMRRKLRKKDNLTLLKNRSENDPFFYYCVNGFSDLVIKTLHDLSAAAPLESDRIKAREFFHKQVFAALLCKAYGLNKVHVPTVAMQSVTINDQEYVFMIQKEENLGELITETNSIVEKAAQIQMDTLCRVCNFTGTWFKTTVTDTRIDFLGYPEEIKIDTLYFTPN